MMNRGVYNFLITLSLMTLMLTGCARKADDVWDDTRTAGRHMSRGFRSLGGKHGESRQVKCREEFFQCHEGEYGIEDFESMNFEPLPDQSYANDIRCETHQRPIQEPGMPSSRIPGIESFQDPSRNPALSRVFMNVHFPYNSNLIKGQENMDILRGIVTYLNENPNVYIFVEGHCDERGAEAYNLALGARRSNAVRNFLIQEGVAPETIFTVSYGKERPLDVAHNEEAWSTNRRAQFKVYQQ